MKLPRLIWGLIKLTAETAFILPFTTKVGWFNRLVVGVGIVCLLIPKTHWVNIVYCVMFAWVFQLVLINVHRRGEIAGAVQLMRDFRGFTHQNPHVMNDYVEMAYNRKVVALEDLSDLCNKYGIPLREVIPIIERGYGFRIKYDNEGE